MNLKQFTLPYGLLADRRADRLGYAANVKERIPNVFNVYRTLETALEEGYFVIPSSVLPQATGASVLAALNSLTTVTFTNPVTFSGRAVLNQGFQTPSGAPANSIGNFTGFLNNVTFSGSLVQFQSASTEFQNATVFNGVATFNSRPEFSGGILIPAGSPSSTIHGQVTHLDDVVFGKVVTFNWTANVTGPSSVLNVTTKFFSTGETAISDLVIAADDSRYSLGVRGILSIDTIPTFTYSGNLYARPIYQFAAVATTWNIPGYSDYDTVRPVYKAQPVARPLTYLSRIVGTSVVNMIDEINSQSGTSPIIVDVDYIGGVTSNTGEFTMTIQHNTTNAFSFALSDENYIVDMAPSMHITSVVTSPLTPSAPENFQSETTITFYTLDPATGLGTTTIPHGWIKLEIYPAL